MREGRVVVPETVCLPEDALVRVIWEDECGNPIMFEDDPLSEEEAERDIAWATGGRF